MPPRPSDAASRVVTANRLDDGVIVYLADSGCWSPQIGAAVAADDDDGLALLMAEADRAIAARAVVGVYAIPVRVEPDGIVPLGQKERIRATGPTIPWGVPVTAAMLEA